MKDTFFKTEDLKDEYRWLAQLHWCRHVGYHTLFHCLATCPKRESCAVRDPRLKELTLREVLREGVSSDKKFRASDKKFRASGKNHRKEVKKMAREQVQKGRNRSQTREKILELSNRGMRPKEIARELGCSLVWVHRVLKRAKDAAN